MPHGPRLTGRVNFYRRTSCQRRAVAFYTEAGVSITSIRTLSIKVYPTSMLSMYPISTKYESQSMVLKWRERPITDHYFFAVKPNCLGLSQHLQFHLCWYATHFSPALPVLQLPSTLVPLIVDRIYCLL